LNRYWLTPEYEEGFDEKVSDINEVINRPLKGLNKASGQKV